MSAFDKQLSERKKQILKAVVEAHIAAGEPVGSKALIERSGLNVSSATIRSEMLELEKMGLLCKPHTSAGRIPSQEGLRLFAKDSIFSRFERNFSSPDNSYARSMAVADSHCGHHALSMNSCFANGLSRTSRK